MIQDYEKKVYTALLGKVIGVYMGRPFEGWKKAAIEKRWGQIDRYVHADCNVPLSSPMTIYPEPARLSSAWKIQGCTRTLRQSFTVGTG